MLLIIDSLFGEIFVGLKLGYGDYIGDVIFQDVKVPPILMYKILCLKRFFEIFIVNDVK